MKLKKLHIALVCAAMVFGSGALHAKTFKWTSASDIPTWDIHSQNNANKLTLIVSALRKSIFGIIGEMEVIPFGAGTKADMINRVRDETSNFYLADMNDLPKSIKTIVLKSLYPAQTNAGFIINGIDKYTGDLTEDEAIQKVASDVTLQLIAQWLVKNVNVSVANG